jgi:hypothetical protein
LLPRNTLTGLFVVFSAAIQPPVIDESASASELLKFVYLFGSWLQFKLKDFALDHSVSRSLRVDVSCNRLIGDSACSRSEIARCPHTGHSAKVLKFFPQDACRIALQSKHNLSDSKMLGTIKKQMNVIRLYGKMQNLDVNLCRFFLQQGN